MTLFDLAVLGLVTASVVAGALRGLVRAAITLAALRAGIMAAARGTSPNVRERFVLGYRRLLT